MKGSWLEVLKVGGRGFYGEWFGGSDLGLHYGEVALNKRCECKSMSGVEEACSRTRILLAGVSPSLLSTHDEVTRAAANR